MFRIRTLKFSGNETVTHEVHVRSVPELKTWFAVLAAGYVQDGCTFKLRQLHGRPFLLTLENGDYIIVHTTH